MKKLLIATTNEAKKNMYRDFLKGEDINLLFLDDFDNIPSSPIEDEDSVEKNALLKARYYFNYFKIPCIADDAGFSISALNGEPGIMARRWGGVLPDNVSDEDWTIFFQKKISSIKEEPFDAYFPYSRCLYSGENNYFFQNGKRETKISHFTQRKPKRGRPSSAFIMDEEDNDLEKRGKSEFIAFIREKFLK